MNWTRSIHLTQWAATDDAPGQLPLLIRRLIRKTAPSVQILNVPAREQVQRPGFDGTVEALEGNQFVPAGRSRWEMGVDKNPKGKAEADFQKRTATTPSDEQKQTAFVFVTPRTWINKDDWAKEKAAESNWRGVVALDANDLEHWLELAPDVDAWFAQLTGRSPAGVQDLGSYWTAVQSIAEHPLAPEVFTASRDAEITAVTSWLSGPASSIFMRSNGLTDALDFLAALSSSEAHDKLQDGLIIHSNEAWRALAARHDSLVLIAAPTLELQASDTASAVSNGHYVFLSGPRGNIASGEGETLRRQDYYAVSQALIASGFSEAPAMSLAKACCGSSSILKRLISRYPETQFPPWSREDVRATLAPFALVGGWTHVNPNRPPRDPTLPQIGSDPPIDVEFVTELVGCDREALDAIVLRWQIGVEPLFLRIGSNVFVASREDAWYLLGGAISEGQLKRFSDLALLVLEEDNPAFDLAPDQRWMANLHGKVHSLSQDLRRSFVETLALMATYPTAEAPVGNVDLKGSVRWVLERALPASATWKRWASFGNNLPIMAEADPEFFLGRVEADLRSNEPALPRLFQDQSNSMFGGAYHTNLLWALEGLAWSPKYLSRVAICLAKLASHDPGGSYANRPDNSLREIFLWWLWHTNADLENRIAALSSLLKSEPAVGWKVLKDLLPGGTPSLSSNTHMPRWRPWANGWSREKLRPQISKYILAIADLTIQVAGLNAQRWSEILEGMLRIGPETTASVFSVLDKIWQTPEAGGESTFSLWKQLRQLLSRHERYAEAGWTFEKTIRDRLAAIRDRLQPTDPVLKNHWLFGYHAELPEFDIVADHAAHDRALHEARLVAMRDIVAHCGAEGVFCLLENQPDGNTVGWIAGASGLLGWKEIQLPAILDTSDNRRLNFISSYIQSCFHADGWKFVDSLPVATWSVHQIVSFARCLPFDHVTWEWIVQFGAEAATEYWETVRPFLRLNPTLDEVKVATRSLIAVDRGFAAIDVLHWASAHKLVLPSDFIAEVLEAALGMSACKEPAKSGDLHYSVQQLVKALQSDTSFDHSRLARIEWGFLALLDPEFSETGPNTLVTAIESEPQFFVELLKRVYRGEKEPPNEGPTTEQDQLMASQAHRLLDKLSRLPGTTEHGTVNISYLRGWLQQVQALSVECNRRAVCDLTLGQLIARGTEKPDELWPSSDVAELLEDLGSDDLFRGFVNGVLNSRGVVSRDPTAGGQPERVLVERYLKLAQYAAPFSPKLAEAFSVLAHQYEAYAKHEDEEAELERLGRRF